MIWLVFCFCWSGVISFNPKRSLLMVLLLHLSLEWRSATRPLISNHIFFLRLNSARTSAFLTMCSKRMKKPCDKKKKQKKKKRKTALVQILFFVLNFIFFLLLEDPSISSYYCIEANGFCRLHLETPLKDVWLAADGRVGFVVVLRHKQRYLWRQIKNRGVPRTPCLGRACSTNDCHRNKNSLTTAFCQYTTTFNMKTTNTSTRPTLYYITTLKALNLSRRQRQKLRAITIFQKWPAGSVLKWKGCISAAELRAVSTKLTLFWKDN